MQATVLAAWFQSTIGHEDNHSEDDRDSIAQMKHMCAMKTPAMLPGDYSVQLIAMKQFHLQLTNRSKPPMKQWHLNTGG